LNFPGQEPDDDPPRFLTPEVLAAVLAEFLWPAPYTLKADFDGIEVCLPRCHLYVTEGFESDMDLAFLPETTGLEDIVSVGDALRALEADPDRALPPEPKLINFFGPEASLEKVQNNARDLLTLLFTYFRPSLEGDFGWVAAYRAHNSL
jgi:hypothetical protein